MKTFQKKKKIINIFKMSRTVLKIFVQAKLTELFLFATEEDDLPYAFH